MDGVQPHHVGVADPRHDLRFFSQAVDLRLLDGVLLYDLDGVGGSFLQLPTLENPSEGALAQLPHHLVQLRQFFLQGDFREVTGILHYYYIGPILPVAPSSAI